MKDKLKQLPDDSAHWINLRQQAIHLMLFVAKRHLVDPQPEDKKFLKELGKMSKDFDNKSKGIYQTN